MNRRFRFAVLLVAAAPMALLAAGPPTCTTHFFDWYVLDSRQALEEKQKQWTYRIDWNWLGIQPEEIGRLVRYYETQCRKIREAGFDGIHYEWHGNPLKAEFRKALETTRLGVAMFYDMQIRFAGRSNFITPTPEFARRFVDDVASFYRPIPRRLWLRDRNGRLPIIVYGYAFDTRVTDREAWDRFYRLIIDGVQSELGQPVVFYWTDTGLAQQIYAFQHFPEIASFTFNEAGRQTQVNARCVTFVVHYDDLGVSFVRGGPRRRRWIRNDIRYLQEALWLARHTDPDLVFNYGWNELYEGEHLLPDESWGTWRYELASAMVHWIKEHACKDLPRVLVIADDLLPALSAATGEEAAVLCRQLELLTRLRALVPQAEVVLAGQQPEFSGYEVIFAVNARKSAAEELRLAGAEQAVVYFNPDPAAETPMTRLFTDRPRSRIARLPANEFVVASCAVDVDLEKYPFLQFRARNSPGSLFHIRYEGLDAAGRPVEAWYESSPTDDRATEGKWLSGQENVARIADRGAGRPVQRLSRIHVILDDLDDNGQFTLDVDCLRLVSPSGQIGWEEEFQSVGRWRVSASFQDQPDAAERFGFQAICEEDRTVGRMRLEATVPDGLPEGMDESTRLLQPRESVRVLAASSWKGTKVPLLLARGRHYWLNSYTPNDDCWETLFGELFGLRLNRGVLFGSFSHALTPDGFTSQRQQSLMVIGEEPLPVKRFRMVAPPELDRPLQHALPRLSGKWHLRVLRGQRRQITWPDPGSDPPALILLPGEIVELQLQP